MNTVNKSLLIFVRAHEDMRLLHALKQSGYCKENTAIDIVIRKAERIVDYAEKNIVIDKPIYNNTVEFAKKIIKKTEEKKRKEDFLFLVNMEKKMLSICPSA